MLWFRGANRESEVKRGSAPLRALRARSSPGYLGPKEKPWHYLINKVAD